MTSTLVDSNVLIDVLGEAPRWFEWSAAALAKAVERSALCVNPIIYAEVAVGYPSAVAVDRALAEEQFERLALPYTAGFLTGRAFLEYRRRSGMRQASLPIFYIGAHALVEGHTLLTRDPARYRTYFPNLRLICPE